MRKNVMMAMPGGEGQLPPEPGLARRPLPFHSLWRGGVAISLEHAWLYGLAFFLGRLNVAGDLSPFGLAFFAALTHKRHLAAWRAGLWAVAGMLTRENYEAAAVCLAVILIYGQLRERLLKWQPLIFSAPPAVFMLYTIIGLAVSWLRHNTLYDTAAVLANALICLSAAYLFGYAVPLLMSRDDAASRYDKAANETMMMFIAVLALAVAGIGDFIIYGYHLQNVLYSMLIMVLAYAGGAGLGAAVGAVAGIIIGFSGHSDAVSFIALYAISGLLGGTFRSMGKFAVILGFVFGALLFHVGFTAAPSFMTAVTEILIASSILFFIPVQSLLALENSLGQARSKELTAPEVLLLNGGKLHCVAQIFSGIAAAAERNNVDEIRPVADVEIAGLLGRIGYEVCEQCDKCRQCWELNYYHSYNQFLALLNVLTRDAPDGQALPPEFRRFCVKAEQMAAALRRIIAADREGYYWRQKFSEQRQVVAGQLKAMAAVIENMAGDICRQSLDKDDLRRVRRTPERRYSVHTACARLAKDGQAVSGDSVKIHELSDGSVCVLLSDGMGSGKDAHAKSEFAVQTLYKLLDNCFDAASAVKLVNSMLLMQSKQEDFATVDLTIIDSCSGEARLFKVAAAPTYVKRVREVREIETESLPAGILGCIEVQGTSLKLVAGDVVVMLSDGIADLKNIRLNRADKSGWLTPFIRKAEATDERAFAQQLLDTALKAAGGEANDDMTAVVIRLTER